MNTSKDEALEDYYEEARSWSEDYVDAMAASRKVAWIVAGAATLIALFEALALVLLLPLKTTVPYALLVDKQTGFVQALDPLEEQSIRPDEAMERSLLAQYVIARESFDIDSLRDSYRKVALWSASEARSRYVSEVQASNPSSPLATMPRRALVEVEIKSISSIDDDTALVRYTTTRIDPSGQKYPAEPMIAVVSYRFSGAKMSAADRLINPLGFQVVRYRRNAELVRDTPPTVVPTIPQVIAPAGANILPAQPAQAAPNEIGSTAP